MRSRSSFRRWTPSRWATHWNSAPVAPGWPDWQGRVVFDCLGVAAVTVLCSPWGSGGKPIKFSCKMNPIVSCELLLLHVCLHQTNRNIFGTVHCPPFTHAAITLINPICILQVSKFEMWPRINWWKVLHFGPSCLVICVDRENVSDLWFLIWRMN